MSSLDAPALAAYIDHTLLAPEATPADVAALAREAVDLGTYSICISPSMLPLTGSPDLGTVKVATVCGFPSGKHTSRMKADEAREAVAHGADEVDMVIDLGLAKAGDADALTAQIALVKQAVPAPHVLKVIIESAALSDDKIRLACRCALDAGADFVKTSTGFHPAGGASVHAIALMRSVVGERCGVKASGGIRDYATAMAMIDAGATRLGCSASRAILAGAPV
ncbi:MAG: deoxyribose-phosphate aldolase [Actinomycetia bacterium]|nr:deoxyribose-phosphate aldolase [Actinomycetes bacterium]